MGPGGSDSLDTDSIRTERINYLTQLPRLSVLQAPGGWIVNENRAGKSRSLPAIDGSLVIDDQISSVWFGLLT